jgi:hypothetical protein
MNGGQFIKDVTKMGDPVSLFGVNKGASSAQRALDPLGLRQFGEPLLPKSMQRQKPLQAAIYAYGDVTPNSATGPSTGQSGGLTDIQRRALLAAGNNPRLYSNDT